MRRASCVLFSYVDVLLHLRGFVNKGFVMNGPNGIAEVGSLLFVNRVLCLCYSVVSLAVRFERSADDN